MPGIHSGTFVDFFFPAGAPHAHLRRRELKNFLQPVGPDQARHTSELSEKTACALAVPGQIN
jgi:hypothetical protein